MAGHYESMNNASMKYQIALLVGGLGMLLSACVGQGNPSALVAAPVATTEANSKPNTPTIVSSTAPTATASSDGWVTLFDGGDPAKYFRGFKKDSFPTGWTVRDGCLVRTGPGGDLITRDEFQNFDLTLDWKIVKGGNSGVMYHVSEDANNTYDTGPEMQILDDDAHNDGKDRLTCAGANYALYPAPKGIVKPVGQWNSIRILCNGNHVEQYMNGVQICSFDAGSADWKARLLASKFSKFPLYATKSTGHIALQDHGDEVAFRNIRIKPLP